MAQSPAAAPNLARKFDEYGRINGGDHSARLDNYTIILEQSPGSQAFIVAYAPKESAREIFQVIQDYLINTRGIQSARIITAYGGLNDDMAQPRVQLWIVPAGAPRPRPQKFENRLKSFQGLFSENRAWDHETFEIESDARKELPILEEEGCGPPVPDVTLVSLADVLKHQRTAVAYIVAYNGEDAAPGAWRRITQNRFTSVKKLGVDQSRLKVVYGGRAKETKVQYWVSRAGDPPPVPDAGPELPPIKTVRLGFFTDHDLANSQIERAALKRMAESLRQFPALVGYVLVRFGTYKESLDETTESLSEEEEPSSDAQNQSEPEPEPADLGRLTEQWKDELARKYKLEPDRFVVIFIHDDGFVGHTLETFVVPPGAKLPHVGEVEEETIPPSQPH